jgi:hypothetical protein
MMHGRPGPSGTGRACSLTATVFLYRRKSKVSKLGGRRVEVLQRACDFWSGDLKCCREREQCYPPRRGVFCQDRIHKDYIYVQIHDERTDTINATCHST